MIGSLCWCDADSRSVSNPNLKCFFFQSYCELEINTYNTLQLRVLDRTFYWASRWTPPKEAPPPTRTFNCRIPINRLDIWPTDLRRVKMQIRSSRIVETSIAPFTSRHSSDTQAPPDHPINMCIRNYWRPKEKKRGKKLTGPATATNCTHSILFD